MKPNTRSLTKSAIVAAIYVALTMALQPISFGPIQFRISEAMTILPILMPEAVPGLFIGCLLANLLGGGMLLDVIVGSMATLLAAIATYRLRRHFIPAAAMPVLFNGVLVGPVVYYCYVMGEGAFSLSVMLYTCMTVAMGEALVVFTLGLILRNSIRNIPAINK